MKQSRYFQRFVGGWLAVGLWALSSSPAMDVRVETLKAAFVLNFLKFVEWPEREPVDTNATFTVAVIGDDSIAPTLQTTLEGKSAQGRKVAVRLFKDAAEWKSGNSACHALFVTVAAQPLWKEIQIAMANRPVLTIGDSPGFCAAGGMLNLFEKDNHIQFEANPRAASRAGLKMRAELLKLATVLPETGGEG